MSNYKYNLPDFPYSVGGVIYLALNMVNGRRYIGQTSRPLRVRIVSHFMDAKYGRKRFVFQKAILKHGTSSFRFYVLELCKNKEERDLAEKFWIKKLNTMVPHGYNLTGGGEGGPLSEEALRKLRRKHSPETCEKLRINATGRKHTEETKKRLSEIAKKRSTPERMKRMSELAKGTWTLERKEKLSKTMKELCSHQKRVGRKWTPERHAKKKLQVVSLETRKKQSEAHKGKHHKSHTITPEHIARLHAGLIAYHERRRKESCRNQEQSALDFKNARCNLQAD